MYAGDAERARTLLDVLDGILAYWWDEGFELTYQRKPMPDDFIVPIRHPRIKGEGHTKSSVYKAMRRACEIAKVRFEGCHLTRHTMITWARRGGAPADVLERVPDLSPARVGG